MTKGTQTSTPSQYAQEAAQSKAMGMLTPNPFTSANNQGVAPVVAPFPKP